MFTIEQLSNNAIRNTALGKEQAKQITVEDAIYLHNLNEAAKTTGEISGFIMNRICNLAKRDT